MEELKAIHYQAMKELGYSDEEIEEDFKQVVFDLELFCQSIEEE